MLSTTLNYYYSQREDEEIMDGETSLLDAPPYKLL